MRNGLQTERHPIGEGAGKSERKTETYSQEVKVPSGTKLGSELQAQLSEGKNDTAHNLHMDPTRHVMSLSTLS